VGYTAGILFLDAVAVLPFAVMRLAHMAKMFAWIRFLNVLSNVLLNVVLILRYGMGVEGIFISGVISSAITLLMLAPVIAGEFRPVFDRGLLGRMLGFSLPTVPAGLALMALQVVDRPILRALTDDATVGIYQANYRLGIFMMIAVSIYDYAWRPFFFSHASDPGARKLFARVMTYVVLALSALFIAFVMFVPDIARLELGGRHFIHPRYWEGLGIVPVVMLGYFFLGISTNLSAGIYIEKKTRYLPAVNVAGALLNIGLNYLLIPRFGIAGAAWATFLAYLAMAGMLYVVVRRIYPVPYEWGRLWKIGGITGGFIVLILFLPGDPASLRVLLQCLLLAAYPAALRFAGVFHAEELAALKRLLPRRSRGPEDTGGAGR
jgi:O-antigen/teichoic acid export membrane protein